MAILSTGVGIDVSDHHVRLAWTNHSGVPKGLYELVLPPGFIVDDRVEKPEGLKKRLLDLVGRSELGKTEAQTVLLVPESRVFSTSIEIAGKGTQDVDRAQALKLGQAEIPIPFREAIVFVRSAYQKKKADHGRMSVLAVEQRLIQEYRSAFELPALPLTAIESGGSGWMRLFDRFGVQELHKERDTDLLMIVDIGHRWTNLTVYDKISVVVFSRSILLKDATGGSGKEQTLSATHLDQVCQMMEESLAYFKGIGLRIPFILLAGAESADASLGAACADRLKEVRIMRVGEAVQIPEVTPEDVHVYGAAIGAALRGARTSFYKKDHNFLVI